MNRDIGPVSREYLCSLVGSTGTHTYELKRNQGIDIRIYMGVYMCVYVCMYVFICVYVCMYVCMHVCM